ncbi:Oleate activated transcription factor 3 [Pleurostoma richardsiae]|uniref:Oleate activated transcription factor 3 n=1 Tax=Pleurostoma richardsiae TaxID=41990 RepID=A0AA38RN45_9PEZI|nr:Oleate activated transcription factor 3 [Pleurostoma richardsiae]
MAFSLEFCQHEGDPNVSSESGRSAQQDYDQSFATLAATNPFSLDPFLESRVGSTICLNPVLFHSLETTEDIHHFIFRSLTQIIGSRSSVESVARYYFGTVNTWFTVVEKVNFDDRLEQLWSEPSAELALLLLSMLLVVRTPGDTPGYSMQNGLYYSIKSMFSLVETKVTLSAMLLQANLLIALYELCHLMPQQAFMTIGACTQMTRAFGWHDASFWAEDRQVLYPEKLKCCSLLWWAIVFLDCGLSVEEHGYPLTTQGASFQIPLPEHFDPLLQPSTASQYGGHETGGLFRFADEGSDRIDTAVWPEAKSASFLLQVMQHSKAPTMSRDELSDAITAYARHIVSRPWKHGGRGGALGVAYIAIIRLNYPQIPHGPFSPSSINVTDRRAVENVMPVITSIVNIAQMIISTAQYPYLDPLVPACGYCAYLAAMTLISLGDTVIHDPEWAGKVQILLQCLEIFSKRWIVAGKHINAINIALHSRLSPTQV